MIKKIVLTKFKRFNNKSIEVKTDGITLLVGGNNSGKSSILHALAIWQFCRTVISYEKGNDGLLKDSNAKGCGISLEEFTPIAIPEFSHLWTNLITQKNSTDKNGYTLRIRCCWDTKSRKNCELEFGLSLANDRLFIKTTDSNIAKNDKIPNIAYLPTFAGITEKERRVTNVEKARQIGKGLAGSVIRNLIYDLYEKNQKKRDKLKEGKSKISSKDLTELRKSDGFELLIDNIEKIFNSHIVVKNFNEHYHATIGIEHYKGSLNNNKFVKYPNYSNRDIMSEGSGYLQWLSVLTLAVDENTDVLLLDEPDAHLHTVLQKELFKSLAEVLEKNKKQVLVATHSSELIKYFELSKIMYVNNDTLKYLSEESQRVGLLNGLGSEYNPKFNLLQTSKKMLILENESDAKLLKIFAETLNIKWPSDLVIWESTDSHKDRKLLYLALSKEITGLKAISLRDRDTEHYNTVGNDLVDKNYTQDSNFCSYKWRRRHIEGYLIIPKVLERVGGISEDEVKSFFSEHSLSINNSTILDSDVSSAIYDCYSKNIISDGNKSFNYKYNKTNYDIAKESKEDEICEDIKTMMNYISNF